MIFETDFKVLELYRSNDEICLVRSKRRIKSEARFENLPIHDEIRSGLVLDDDDWHDLYLIRIFRSRVVERVIEI